MLMSPASGSALAFDPGRQAPCGAVAMHAPHSPKQNRLLAYLSAEDYQRLLPDLELVPIRPLPARVHLLAVSIQDRTR
jgi:hypothetical protein